MEKVITTKIVVLGEGMFNYYDLFILFSPTNVIYFILIVTIDNILLLFFTMDLVLYIPEHI
jgi:hypothetical protein